jgi:hypothetical protein
VLVRGRVAGVWRLEGRRAAWEIVGARPPLRALRAEAADVERFLGA